MTISAHDWLEQTSVDARIGERWPAYRVVLVAADAVDGARLAAVVDDLIAQAHEIARGLGADLDPHVARWQDAFRDFGVKPRVARSSVDALIRRAASDNGLPRINPLVDVYNAISVIHRVPIGGEDLDRYTGAAHLTIATGDETFHTTANCEPVVDPVEPGEPVWLDGGGVTCRRWNWRQTTRTAIHEGTQRVGFIIDSLDAPDHAGAHAAADHLARLLPGAVGRPIG